MSPEIVNRYPLRLFEPSRGWLKHNRVGYRFCFVGRAIGSGWQGPPGFQRERAVHQGIEAAVAQDPNGLGKRRQHDKKSAARPSHRSPLTAIECCCGSPRNRSGPRTPLSRISAKVIFCGRSGITHNRADRSEGEAVWPSPWTASPLGPGPPPADGLRQIGNRLLLRSPVQMRAMLRAVAGHHPAADQLPGRTRRRRDVQEIFMWRRCRTLRGKTGRT